MKKYKKVTAVLLAMMITVIAPVAGFARSAESQVSFDLTARAAILIEETTGKILYAKNAGERMYPASMTKILTAMITLEYLDPEEIVVAGSEVYDVPLDSSKAGNLNGEYLKVINLIRLIIIPSGTETSCVAAKAVALKITGRESMQYSEAESIFIRLMNEKAQELGAVNSNFVNPHGYHDDNHYTTAEDMAIICREAMKNEIIRKIVREPSFKGNGAGENPDPEWKTKEYNWNARNELLPGAPHAYPYATGMKTGFTDEAGNCLAASAEKGLVKLISVVMYSTEADRWEDTTNLFEYGFSEFSFQVVQQKGVELDIQNISNPRLGEEGILAVLSGDRFEGFFGRTEFTRIQREIEYNEELIVPPSTAKDGTVKDMALLAPVAEGDVIGKVVYTLDGEGIFEGDVVADQTIDERTFNSDVKYYFDQFRSKVFTLAAIPFWAGSILIIFCITRVLTVLKRRRNYNQRKLRHRN